MPPSVFLLSLALIFASHSEPVRHFNKIPASHFPRAVVMRDFCRENELGCSDVEFPGESSPLQQEWP
jgi:hypothetical protein